MAYVSLFNWITTVSVLAAAGFWTGLVFAQETDFGQCVQSSNSCGDSCASQNWPAGCGQACNEVFLNCSLSRSGGQGGGLGGGRLIERSGCFPDRTSSTGWRLRACATVTGAPGQATRCSWSDECPTPGCGPCKCTRAPNGTYTCTNQCFRYNQAGRPSPSPRACKPPPPKGSQ